MEFDFSDEQQALRDTARELFEKESPASRLREVWASGRDDAVWRSMAAVGILGLTIPAEHGGMGGDETDLVLVLEEAGRAGLPEPLVETVAVGVPVIGSAPLAGDWLPRIARGDALVAVQLAGAPFALDADLADLLVLERDGALHGVPRGGFRATPVASGDGARRLFTIEADVSAQTRLQAGAADAFLRGAAATAAVLNGVCLRLLDMTLEHVKSRKQFGRPIGEFQAIQHGLADMFVLVESSRAAAWYAAYAIARSLPDAAVASSVAKAYASEAAAAMNTAALQCHGGIGFTWEHDLHLWLKRGKALEQAFGSAAEHRALVARALLEPA